MNPDLFYLLIPAVCWLLLLVFLVFFRRKTGAFPLSSGFFLSLCGLFLVYVPVSDYLFGIRESYGFLLPYTPEINRTIAAVYSMAMIGFGAGSGISLLLLRKKEYSLPFRIGPENASSIRLLYGFQVLVWLVYFFNLSLSGISLTGLFNPLNQSESGILFSAAYRFPLLELFSASVPVCLFIQLTHKENKKALWWIFFLFWLLMSLLGGWRFRIILFALFCLLYFFQAGYPLKKALIFCALLATSMAWLTLNRMAIAKRQFELITFDLRLFDWKIFNNEFSNCRTFRACLCQPAADSFPGIQGWMKEGPDLAPGIIRFSKSWIPSGWPWNPNPALSQPEEFYFLFGFSGLFVMMAAIGLLCSWLDRIRSGFYSRIFSVLMTALLFQWFSRGYFPFQLKITLICLMPLLLLWFAGRYLSPQSHGNKA